MRVISGREETWAIPTLRLVHTFQRTYEHDDEKNSDKTPCTHFVAILHLLGHHCDGNKQNADETDGQGDDQTFSAVLLSSLCIDILVPHQ